MKKLIALISVIVISVLLLSGSAYIAARKNSAAANPDNTDLSFSSYTDPVSVSSDILSENTADSDTQILPDGYREIISRYGSALTEKPDPLKMEEDGLNPFILTCIADDENARVGYALSDDNGLSQQTLAIICRSENSFYNGLIVSMYDLADGLPDVLVQSGERDRWYCCGSGMLYNESSSSTSQSCCSLCTADRELAYLDAVEYDAVLYPDAPWLHFTGDTWEHISSSDAESIRSEMKSNVSVPDLCLFK